MHHASSAPACPAGCRPSGAVAAAALVLALVGPAAQAAGKVDVTYVEPEKFTDVGWESMTRDRNLSNLTSIFETLGRFLPDGRTLRVDVLDVDLAGEPRPGTVRELRVVRGGIDWPQITLRYTLLDDGKAIRSAEERVQDSNYLSARRGLTAAGSNLPYEKRMVENWFRVQFLQAQ